MGGKRISEEELQKLEVLMKEGLTNREISEKLGRSEAGIRNLRYRNSLVSKAEDESKVLFQRRNELKRIVVYLNGQKTSLIKDVDRLKKEKEKFEDLINVNKSELYQVLVQALVNLKQQRPDLFYITGQDQIVSLIQFFLRQIKDAY